MPRLMVSLAFLSLAGPLLAQEVTGSAAVTAQYRDPETIQRITLRLAGQGRESWDTVIKEGDEGQPPLTWGTVAAFSLLLHECFDAQLTEAEAELVAKQFAESYEASDGSGRKALVSDWKQMLEALAAGGAAERAKVRAKLESRIELYFMWVAAGRAPELVTLENVALIRAHFLSHFAELPPDMQYALANAQKIYAGLRVLWYTGGGPQRATMSRNFNQELNALGLTDPNAGARSQSASDAHGAFAAEMVVGLAGSSYKSAW